MVIADTNHITAINSTNSLYLHVPTIILYLVRCTWEHLKQYLYSTAGRRTLLLVWHWGVGRAFRDGSDTSTIWTSCRRCSSLSASECDRPLLQPYTFNSISIPSGKAAHVYTTTRYVVPVPVDGRARLATWYRYLAGT